MTTFTSEAEAVIDLYTRAWNEMNFKNLGDLWDQEEPDLYYVAEEVDTPLYKFEDISAYWNQTSKYLEWVKIHLSNKRFKLLSDTLLVVTFEMHVDVSVRVLEQQSSTPVGADVRVSAILKNRDNQWRFIHYAEAALGTLPFIRKMYQNNVRLG